MGEILVVVDMQNDFIDGALGTKEAAAIVPAVAERIRAFPGRVIFTRDTHRENYLSTQEGGRLPVPHCIRGSCGWEIRKELRELAPDSEVIDKPVFGSKDLGQRLLEIDEDEPISRVTLVGLCTDICVISNALLIKSFLPEVTVAVDAACCAGATPESHLNALAAMRACQIDIING